jgi:dihydroorotate dehydrogenase electron transfer subunit
MAGGEGASAPGATPGRSTTRHRVLAEVCESTALPGDHRRLVLRAPEIVASAQPGQFVNVWCHPPAEIETPPSAAVLRRPLSVSRLRPPDQFELLLRVRGVGGRILSGKRRGDVLDTIGPLGHGFAIPEGTRLAVVIAGGIGLAPVPFLAEALVARGIRTVLLAGATADERLPFAVARPAGGPVTIPELTALGAEVEYVSEAIEGAVVGRLLERRLEEFAAHGAGFYAIGPRPMLRSLVAIVGDRAPLQVSLEERMACGVGACRSCVVPALGPHGPEYRTTCREGPVFSASEVDWERLE